MLSLKKLLSKVLQKQSWKLLGTSTGQINYPSLSAAHYTEVMVSAEYGGVRSSQVVPIDRVGKIVPYIGILGLYPNGRIYVNLQDTYSVITEQPTGYIAQLYVYAR